MARASACTLKYGPLFVVQVPYSIVPKDVAHHGEQISAVPASHTVTQLFG